MILQSWLHRLTSAIRTATSSQTWRSRQRPLPRLAFFAESLELRIVPVAPNVDLSTLLPVNGGNGSIGVTLFGVEADDRSGRAVHHIGDMNGDGFDDLLIGAYGGDGAGNAKRYVGESYVVFGKADWSVSPTLDLATLNGTNGFTLVGVDVDDRSGRAVSGTGDVNGDGFDDLLIGALSGDAAGNTKGGAGESYLVFGKADWSASPTLELAALNGTNGFTLFGVDISDYSGVAVSGPGDVNGDGFADLLIGALRGDAAGNAKRDAGESYVVFGKADWSTSPTLDLATLNGANGFTLFGVDANDGSGSAVSGAGDINGDGFDDLLIGALSGDAAGNTKSYAGESYVVFGKADWSASPALDLSTLNGSNGFTLFGIDERDFSGQAVSGAGDVNGDGFDDLLIGAPGGDAAGNAKSNAGESYMVFGKADWSASPTLDLGMLNGTNGFTLFGIDMDDGSGRAVSGVGDVNGDGFDDLLIGASFAAAAGNAKTSAGESYMVFGKADWSASPTLDLATLNGTNGFTLFGVDVGDRSGRAVSGTGDVNGDGFDDLLIGTYAEESSVVFGGNLTNAVTHPGTSAAESLSGTSGADVIVGGQGNDTLVGNGDADVLTGGQGNDILAISDLSFLRIVGGTGTDTLRLDGSSLTLNLTTLADNRIQGVEQIDITGSGDNTLTLDLQEVLNISDESNTLLVRRNSGDTVNIRTGWTQGTDETIGPDTFEVFTQGAATLKVMKDQSSNTAPVVANLTDATDEETTFSGNVTATDADAEDTSFTISLVGETPAGVTFNSDGSFTVAPQLADQALAVTESRLVQFDYQANDGKDDSNTATVGITINGRNDNPTLANEIADQVATETNVFSFTVAADTFDDIDASDVLTYSATQADGGDLPTWLTFDPNTRTFSGTPTNTDVGRLSITVTAMDPHEGSVSTTFDLAVLGTAIVVSGGVGTITDIGGPSHDAIEITIDGDNLVVTLEGQTTEISLAGLTELIINGGGGDDTLTVDLGGGPLPFNITFNGGVGGHDTLVVTGFDGSGQFNAYNANYTNRHDGNIQFRDGGTILSTLSYTGLEPIALDGTPDEIVFNLPSTNDTDVRLLDIGGADGLMRLTGSTFETTDFSIAAATSITINANAGNDRVTIPSVDAGYSGQLIVNGGAGNDVLTATASPIAVTLRGDAGNDTLTGSANDDTLSGGLGNDSLNGANGNDTVAEGDTSKLTLKNNLLTGRGNDKLTSIEQAVVTGTDGNNVLDASAFTLGNVTLLGGDGNDTLLGSAFDGATDDDDFNDSLDGGAGTDVARQSSSAEQTLEAGPDPDTVIVTGAGSDLWRSIEGAQLVFTGKNATTLDASAFSGNATLEGGSGNDTLIGGQGNNLLNGNAGNDSLIGGDTADTMYGGAGNDQLDGRSGSDFLKGQAGNDTQLGGAGDDRMFGEAGRDLLIGGGGQDLMDGGADNDVIDGEAGQDVISGGSGNDAIRGGDGDDQINGGAGNDTLIGGSGSDVLRSGSGSDRLSGGVGNDRFEANGARITLGGGDDTVVGNNRVEEVFTFDFDKLLL